MDKLGRPDWIDYFMTLAFIVSQRSIDRDTKHGTVIVSEDNTVLSMGYNGPPRGCVDYLIPLTRPDKYRVMIHSETAAIVNAARHGIPLVNSTFYITGYPCEHCLGEIINAGAKKVIYGPIKSKCMIDSDALINNILVGQPLEILEYKNNQNINKLLMTTIEYKDNKLKGQDNGTTKSL